ncbi:MAG: superoxide dismutase [Culturomica sp.]|jgi:Fe-Mn family superoxide dismutase|nr:superoxide dismutase [Culturomica sp.]
MHTEKQIPPVLLKSDEINRKNGENNFVLLPFFFAEEALEPYMSRKTVEFHYGKHLAGYIDNTNKLKKGSDFDRMKIEEIMLASDGKLFNNAAQVFNHYFQFEALKPAQNGAAAPSDELKSRLEKSFGSLDGFKSKFSEAAVGLFGSGYVWLVSDKNGELEIVQTKNADNPLTDGKKPLLNLDVWEHAYYLDVQNLRAKYVENFWHIVDWEKINERLGR